MQNTGNDVPHGLRFVRGESEGSHGGVDGFVIASVGSGGFIVILISDEVVSGRVADQTQLVQFGLAAATQ